MYTNYNSNPLDAKHYDTDRLREEFLNERLFVQDEITLLYSHIDRVVALGVCPKSQPLLLDEYIDNEVFGTEYFLQRRELGMVNLGEGAIEVRTASNTYRLEHLDALYLAKGEQDISFHSLGEGEDAFLYCLSAPAHHVYSSRQITRTQAKVVELGATDTSNLRVINQYLHPDVLQTCQLCMGVTHLAPGSVWNTMPAHTHERRMEAYLYFNVQPNQVVFHFMGEPTETRHIVVRNRQLVLSPSWSIHSGCGTSNYSFVWGMLGENQTFDDMDFVDMTTIR